MKMLFHIGLHRAASTSLRQWLNEGRQALAEHRIFAATELAGYSGEAPFAFLIGERLEKLGSAAAAEMVEDELARLAHKFEIVIVSDENLPGMMVGRGPRAFEALDRLALLLRVRNAIIPVVILREQVSWLISAYRMYQWRGELKSFEQFVSDIDPASLEFAPFMERLAEASGTRPVIGTLDAIAADGGKSFVDCLSAIMGLGSELPSTFPVRNVSHPPLACALVQEAARLGAGLATTRARSLREHVAFVSGEGVLRGETEIAKLGRLVARRAGGLQCRFC